MESKRDFFDILDSVINKSIAVTEKVVVDAIPTATTKLLAFEEWLNAKLNDTKKT